MVDPDLVLSKGYHMDMFASFPASSISANIRALSVYFMIVVYLVSMSVIQSIVHIFRMSAFG